MDIEKMKVVELRLELSNRNLDTKGTKIYLQERLRKALEAEGTPTTSSKSSNLVESRDVDMKEEEEEEEEETSALDKSNSEIKENTSSLLIDNQSSANKEVNIEGDKEKAVIEQVEKKDEKAVIEQVNKTQDQAVVEKVEQKKEEKETVAEQVEQKKEDKEAVIEQLEQKKEENEAVIEQIEQKKEAVVEQVEQKKETVVEQVEQKKEAVVEQVEQKKEVVMEQVEQKKDDEAIVEQDKNDSETKSEEEDKMDISEHEVVKENELNDSGKEKGSKQQRRGQKRRLNGDEPYVVVEDEPEISESAYVLDWYNSDLHLKIDKVSLMKGEPFFKDGWAYVWAGVKATHGFDTQGKIGFEVKLLDNCEARLEKVENLHELRIGFSTDEHSMQLGESLNSFAFAASAKKATNGIFESYGKTFEKGDVVGAFLDLDSETASLTFTINGESQTEAFSFPKSQLEGKALYPHICTRNIKFEVNFGKNLDGSEKEAFFPPLEGFVYAANYEKETVRGPSRIATRAECEMVMMIGLPASGKTTWVNKHVEMNPNKRYNVIGTTALMDKMKVDGAPLKSSHEGRWDLVTQKCTRCLQDWLRLASQRRRNVIIDQTNVYPNAQKRKIRPFEGMNRKAVVIVPSDADYISRVEAQEKAGNKDVPNVAILELKAHFTLPSTEITDESPLPSFQEIIYPELDYDEAFKVVEEYNKTAKNQGYGKKQMNHKSKRNRGNNYLNNRSNLHRMRGGRNNTRYRGVGGGGGGNMYRGGLPHRFFRGGPPSRGGGMRGAFMPTPLMRGSPGPLLKPQQHHRNNGNHNNRQNNYGKSPWRNELEWSRPRNNSSGGGGWGPWNQMSQDGWRHHMRPPPPLPSMPGGPNNQGGYGGGNFSGSGAVGGGGLGGNYSSNWSTNGAYNQGYPGNSNWGGGGYGGR